METTIENKGTLVEATQIRTSTTIRTPIMGGRNVSLLITTLINEKGEIILQKSVKVSATLLSNIRKTEAGIKLERETRGEFDYFLLTPDIEVTPEAQAEYDERKKSKK